VPAPPPPLGEADSVNYTVELVQLGLDSMTAVAVLLDMEKTFGIRFPDEMLVEGTFRTAGALKEAVQLLESARRHDPTIARSIIGIRVDDTGAAGPGNRR